MRPDNLEPNNNIAPPPSSHPFTDMFRFDVDEVRVYRKCHGQKYTVVGATHIYTTNHHLPSAGAPLASEGHLS